MSNRGKTPRQQLRAWFDTFDDGFASSDPAEFWAARIQSNEQFQDDVAVLRRSIATLRTAGLTSLADDLEQVANRFVRDRREVLGGL